VSASEEQLLKEIFDAADKDTSSCIIEHMDVKTAEVMRYIQQTAIVTAACQTVRRTASYQKKLKLCSVGESTHDPKSS